MSEIDFRDPNQVDEWLKAYHTLVIEKISYGDVEMHTTCAGLTDACRDWDICGICANLDEEQFDGQVRPDEIRHGALHKWDEVAWVIAGDYCMVTFGPLATAVYGAVLRAQHMTVGEYEITDFRITEMQRQVDVQIGRRIR